MSLPRGRRPEHRAGGPARPPAVPEPASGRRCAGRSPLPAGSHAEWRDPSYLGWSCVVRRSRRR